MNRFFLFTEKKEDDRVSRAKNSKYESMSLEELKASGKEQTGIGGGNPQ